MPDPKRISELSTAATLNGTDLLEIAQVNAGSSSGYASAKTTMTALANKIAKGIQFGDLQTTAKDLIDAINEAAISGGNSNIADDYDNTQTYVVGDYCIYEGDLYRCITAVTVAESFDSTKWTAVLVTDELGQGGTTVIANPQGTPTDELQTIQIGNDIYEIVGGSSGGSGGGDILINDRDWTLITSSFGTTQLTNTYDYYLWIVICNGKIDHYKIIDSSLLDLETNEDSIIEYKSWDDGQGAYSSSRVTITASSVTLWDNNQSAVSAKLYGANKKSSGGGSTSWTDVTGTLTAGQTSLTLTNSVISEDSTFDFYTSKFGVNPTDVSVSAGSITLTFDVQNTDLDVKVRVTNDMPVTPVDMSGISKYNEASMSASSTNTKATMTWYEGGSAIGLTAYYSVPIDVTNIDKLYYELKTGSCYGMGTTAQRDTWYLMIGLRASAPSSIINATYANSGFVAGDYFVNSNTNYGTQEIDVSELTGNYYLVINAHGWNAEISNLRSV